MVRGSTDFQANEESCNISIDAFEALQASSKQLSEKHIAARKHKPTILDRGEIDLAADLFHTIPVRRSFTVNAQARHTTIGINLETKMGPAPIAGNRKLIQRVTVQICLREDLNP